MGKELHVSDETFALARRIAERSDRSIDDIVAEALRRVGDERRAAEAGPSTHAIDAETEMRRRAMPAEDEDVFSEEAIARRRERRRALVAENRRHLRELPRCDDSEFYDDDGLPK